MPAKICPSRGGVYKALLTTLKILKVDPLRSLIPWKLFDVKGEWPDTLKLESYIFIFTLLLLPKPTIVVSYADTGQGHVGYVYQSTNFIYTGLSANRVDWAVKGLEHKHSKTLSDGMTLESIKEKYGDDFYYTERTKKMSSRTAK